MVLVMGSGVRLFLTRGYLSIIIEMKQISHVKTE